MNNTAYLSNNGRYISFKYNDRNIKFIGSKSLEKFLEVKTWDNGYIVVQAQNYGRAPEEDYIDLIPILENLLIDPEEFLAPIKEVKLRYV